MKLFILLSTTFVAFSALAEDWPVMQGCNDAENSTVCRTASGATAIATTGLSVATGIKTNRIYREAKLTEVDNTIEHFNDDSSRHFLTDREIRRQTQPIKEGAKVTIHYYLNPQENKARYISRQQGRINRINANIESHYAAARRWDTATEPIYEWYTEVTRDQDGKVISRNRRKKVVGYRPVAGREFKAAEERRKARRLQADDLPQAQAKMGRLRKGDPTDENMFPRTKDSSVIDADYRARNVTADLRNHVANGRVVWGMDRVTAQGMKEAKALRWKGRGGIVGTAAGVAATGVEVFTGGTGRVIDNTRTTGFGPIMEDFSEAFEDAGNSESFGD